ncbi:MAG: membrane integrity-associated transporter subunit PqiC [Desulfuromonadales bacterium]|nr:membrane integrity-associated transporter subunit PqiC [Desulfuromonadales bacterium]
MKTVYTSGAILLLSCALFLLTGCASSPQARFYTLIATASQGTPSVQGATPSVAIASVTIPELVDRPQLVVRYDDSSVELLETHRWAEPLKSAVSRAMAENLSRLLVSDRVSSYPQAASLSADFKVYVDLQRFEYTGKQVELDALWFVRRQDDSPAGNGRSQVREPVTGSGYEGAVAAFSRGLAGVSLEIAQALKKEWSGGK